MSDSEKISFIQFLVAESYKKDQQIERIQQTIDAQGERQSVMQLTLDKIESALRPQFLKNYLTAYMEECTDFENLTPAILGKIN